MTSSTERVVVVAGRSHPLDPAWHLPSSRLVDRTWIFGGERGLYELAFAAAATGRDVELRGQLAAGVFEELASVTTAHPRLGDDSRRPEPHETVIVPEGIPDSITYARVALSPARAVMLLLAPPGLWGWPFMEAWEPPDCATVDLAALARPEHFRAMVGLGFELWANSRPLERAARASGTDCTWIGEASPKPFPPVPEKTHDVVVVHPNRWSSFADEVVDGLPVSCLVTSESRHDDLVAPLARARILVWPSRVEGHSRIQCEARAMGTVPVALDTNPFAVDLDREHGAVVVSSLTEMRDAIVSLLQRPDELAELARRGEASARAMVDWAPYVARVDMALRRSVEPGPTHGARARFGADISRSLDLDLRAIESSRARARFEELEDRHRQLEAAYRALEEEHRRTEASHHQLEAWARSLQEQRAGLEATYHELEEWARALERDNIDLRRSASSEQAER